MTETSTEHGPGDDSTPTLDTLADKVDRLADTVAGLVDRFHGAAASHEAEKLDRPNRAAETTQQHAEGLRGEIQSELAKLRAQEAADRKQKDLEARVSKAEKAAERPPREFRRIHHAMGWVTDDDR